MTENAKDKINKIFEKAQEKAAKETKKDFKDLADRIKKLNN